MRPYHRPDNQNGDDIKELADLHYSPPPYLLVVREVLYFEIDPPRNNSWECKGDWVMM